MRVTYIMKKILIVNNNMHIGGVQKSLVNLLRNIADEYQITLLLLSDRGELMEEIPDCVRVITPKSPYVYLGLTRNDRVQKIHHICRGFFAAIARVFGRSWAIRMMAPFQNTLEGYDVAVSFLHSGAKKSFYGGCNEFVLRHVRAKTKVTFLHCDYGMINADIEGNRKIYEAFDRIAACSEGCRRAFLEHYPHLAERVYVAENFCDFDSVREKAAQEPILFDADQIHIVTVARLGKEKGVARGVQAIAKLGQLSKKVHYHIIGSGTEYDEVRQLIASNGLADTVTMYGQKANPYGYIQAADMLLIPSVSEAAPMVIHEAAVLGTPILSTKTSSAEEMIQERGLGWVCENSVEGMADMLTRLLADPKLLEEKKNQLERQKFDNGRSEDQIRQIIG